jgi:hypothetical protein
MKQALVSHLPLQMYQRWSQYAFVDIHLFKKWSSAILLQTVQHGENVVGIFLK